MEDISIWVASAAVGNAEPKGAPAAVLKSVPISALRESLKDVCGDLTEALRDIRDVGRFRLAEVSVGVEVSAVGGISLIGTASVEGKGAITLKFEDVDRPAP